MKILLPSKAQCKRVYTLLSIFYDTNKSEKGTIENFTTFNHALTILCSFYNINKPNRIRFRRSFRDKECVGMCYESGNIDLLYPYDYQGDFTLSYCRQWIGVFFHEFGHYYLWSKAEEKADEYESKMLNCCCKKRK